MPAEVKPVARDSVEALIDYNRDAIRELMGSTESRPAGFKLLRSEDETFATRFQSEG